MTYPFEIAHVAIGCVAYTGEKGCFLFTGEYHRGEIPVSPVFDGLIDLYYWARLNGWRQPHWDELPAERQKPTGTYIRPIT